MQIVVAVVASFVGSTVFSTVGFGIGMVAIPIFLLVLDPQTAVVMLNTVEVPLMALMVFQNRSHLKVAETVPIAASGLVGALVGVFILESADERPLRISIVALIIALTVVTAFNFRGPIPKPHVVGPIVGFVVGLMLTTLAIGGPILALFMLALLWQRHAMRGSMSLYFLFIMLTAVFGYAVRGLYTSERAILTAIVTLPVVMGFLLGSRFARNMNERVFRNAAIAVIMVTSLVVLIRELAQLY